MAILSQERAGWNILKRGILKDKMCWRLKNLMRRIILKNLALSGIIGKKKRVLLKDAVTGTNTAEVRRSIYNADNIDYEKRMCLKQLAHEMESK